MQLPFCLRISVEQSNHNIAFNRLRDHALTIMRTSFSHSAGSGPGTSLYYFKNPTPGYGFVFWLTLTVNGFKLQCICYN